MALRAQEHRHHPDPMLAAYLDARRRYEPPAPPRPRTDDLMLARYLRARERMGIPAEDVHEPDLRTCPHCGERAPFVVEAGSWSACATCGHYA